MKTIILIIVFALSTFGTVNSTRYALLVGQNNGGKGLARLKYAHTDATRFSDLLIELGGFDKSNVIVVLGADSADIEDGFSQINRQIESSGSQKNSMFLFYYSGHADEESLLLGKTKLPLQKIETRLNSVQSSVKVGVFDACQSGVVTSFKGGKRTEPFFLKEQSKIEGNAIIASSSANELSQESKMLKGSIFSFHWMNGLRGSADLSSDRKVTINEAYQYAYRKTVETSALTSGTVQHPEYRFNIKGQGEIVLTDLKGKSDGGVYFDGYSNGKFLILSENYMDVYADFYKEKGKTHFISLSPGTYTLINAKGKDVGTCIFSVDKNKSFTFLESMLVANTRTESSIKGAKPDKSNGSEMESLLPLSRFKMGFGGGAHAVFDGAKDETRKDFSVGFAISYLITENTNFFSDVNYLISDNKCGLDFGFDYILPIGAHNFNAGLGGGFEYAFDKGAKSEALEPFFVLKPGLDFILNRQVKLGICVPYRIIFGTSVFHRMGLEMRIMFGGKYSDVKMVES